VKKQHKDYLKLQIAAAGEANLDFQSSIEKEMMAEILLGKDLNLETLRLASLQGNEIVVAKEMNKLLADNFDKTKGNKISQQALADLLGVSVDEMHEMNQTRLLQNKLSEFGAEDRIKAEKEVNRLVSKGMTQEAALKAIADGKLETSIAAGKEAEASARILENAKETLMVNIAPLAEKISKFIAKIAESKELSFKKSIRKIFRKTNSSRICRKRSKRPTSKTIIKIIFKNRSKTRSKNNRKIIT